MIVVNYTSLEDFLSDLRINSTQIAHKLVRFDGYRRAEQNEAITFEVGCWATCVVLASDGDFLMECALECGCDDTRRPATREDGTKFAAKARAKLAELCDDFGLSLRPGKIEVF